MIPTAQIAFEGTEDRPAHTGGRLGMARIPLEAKDFGMQNDWPMTFIAIPAESPDARYIRAHRRMRPANSRKLRQPMGEPIK